MEINRSKITTLPPFRKRLLSRAQSTIHLNEHINERDTDLKYPTVRRLLNGRIESSSKIDMHPTTPTNSLVPAYTSSNPHLCEMIHQSTDTVNQREYYLNDANVSPMLLQVIIYTTLGIKLPKLHIPYTIEDDATYLVFRLDPRISIPMSTSNIIIHGISSKLIRKATSTTVTIDGTDKATLALRLKDILESGIIAIIKTGTYKFAQSLGNSISVTGSNLVDDINLNSDRFTYGTMLIDGPSPLLISQIHVIGDIKEHDIKNSEALIKIAATFMAENIDALKTSNGQELLSDPDKIPNFSNLRDSLDGYIAFKLSTLNSRFTHIEEQLHKQSIDTDFGPMEVNLPDKLDNMSGTLVSIQTTITELMRKNAELVTEVSSHRKTVLDLERQLNLKIGNGHNSDVVYFGNNLGRSVTNILIGTTWSGTNIDGVYESSTPDWQIARTHIVKKVDTNSFIVVADLVIKNLLPAMVHTLRYNGSLTRKYRDDNNNMITLGYTLVYEVRTSFGQYLVYRLRADADTSFSGVIDLSSVILCGTPKFDVTSVVIP